MHFRKNYEQWKQNSLISMKTPEDWRPVIAGVGIIVAFLGAAFVKYYLTQKKLKSFELEVS